MLNNLKTLSLAVMVVLFSACSSSNDARVTLNQKDTAKPEKQNIVMIIVDDLRPVLGAYGDKNAHTPNIDALARQGITFKQAYANVPVCGASRASMLTSLRPNKTRFLNHATQAEVEAPGAKSLPQVLKESGYYTMGMGKIFHVGSDLAEESWSEKSKGTGQAHDVNLNPESEKYKKPNPKKPGGAKGPWYEIADVANEAYPDGKVKNKALAALSVLAKKEQPFFLSIGFIRPHLPFNAPKKYYDLHPENKFSPFFHREQPHNAPSSLKGSGEIRSYHFKGYDFNSDDFHIASLRGYYASVSYIDALVGEVITHIDSLGLRDNTTIVLLSDHGFSLGEHNFWTKHTMLETSLRIPMIISGPGIEKNKSTDALVELLDIFPTIADIAGVNTPGDIDGKSVAPVLKNSSLEHKKYIYSRFNSGDTIVTDDFIFTSYQVNNNQVEEMLYDLEKDPHETVNVVNEKVYQSKAAELRALLNNCTQKKICHTH